MDEKLVIQGAAHVDFNELLRNKSVVDSFGEERVVVCKVKLQGEESTDTKHGGLRQTVKARLSDVLVLSVAEAKDYERELKARRIEREEEAKGQTGMIDPEDDSKVRDLDKKRKRKSPAKKTTRGKGRGKDTRDK